MRFVHAVDFHIGKPFTNYGENSNRLLIQYLPGGTDLPIHSQTKLSATTRQLNEKPRKAFQYDILAEKFAQYIASIN
jgi:IS30 family transposase